jgi:glucokinase
MIGTGVGGGVVVDGQPFEGAHGLAVEAGHVVAVPGGERCACGRLGCVEAYAGGRALVRRYGALAGPGGSPARTAEEVVALARTGDPVAARVWADATASLTVLVRAIVLLFDPDVLARGGGVGGGVAELRHALAASAADDAWPGVPPPAVVELDSGAVMVGAARLAWEGARER